MGYHGLYQINDMKLKPVELWLIKRLIAAVSSASCPPDSSASLSTPCGWQYHLSSRLSLTILSIQGWHYQTLDEDRHVSGVVYVDRHTVRSLKPWFTPNPVGVSRHWPIPFFWISLDVHPSKYTGAGTKSRERRKKFFGFPLLFHPTSGKIWENDTRQLPLPPQVHR